jgi:hypothetical protein
MLMPLPAALHEERQRSPRGENGCRAIASALRQVILQRENTSNARMKKQHLPMKKPVFHLDAPSFSISIRSASECSFRW